MGKICAWSVLVLVLACGDDSGDSGGGSGDSSSGSSSSTTAPMTTAPMTTEPMTTAPMETGPTGPTCGDTQDCESCWDCASTGPCKTEYDACAGFLECAGSLFCIDSMCTPNGIPSSCTDLCCMNCMEHNTCSIVDPYLTCVVEQCPGICQPNSC